MPAEQPPIVVGSAPLYAGATPLQPARHADAAILADAPFHFAAKTPTVPITVDEFERAALDYPIVFFGPARRAVIVDGLSPTRNLFVNADGRYRQGAYVPAYLRRHPFVLARDEGEAQWVVCLDERSERLVVRDDPDAMPLFADGRPTPVTQEAIAFCRAFEDAMRRTEAFTLLLDELDLFEPRQAHYRPRLADGSLAEPTLLLDYVAVSRERLDALAPDAQRRIHDSGMTAALWAHVLSAANWDVLALLDAD